MATKLFFKTHRFLCDIHTRVAYIRMERQAYAYENEVLHEVNSLSKISSDTAQRRSKWQIDNRFQRKQAVIECFNRNISLNISDSFHNYHCELW